MEVHVHVISGFFIHRLLKLLDHHGLIHSGVLFIAKPRIVTAQNISQRARRVKASRVRSNLPSQRHWDGDAPMGRRRTGLSVVSSPSIQSVPTVGVMMKSTHPVLLVYFAVAQHLQVLFIRAVEQDT